jgi:hypothetical protein
VLSRLLPASAVVRRLERRRFGIRCVQWQPQVGPRCVLVGIGSDEDDHL